MRPMSSLEASSSRRDIGERMIRRRNEEAAARKIALIAIDEEAETERQQSQAVEAQLSREQGDSVIEQFSCGLRTGVFYQKDGKVVTTVNSSNTTRHINDRLCQGCASSEDYIESKGAFILCDNRHCGKGGGHLRCLGLEHMPANQWFCVDCLNKAKCSDCKKPIVDKSKEPIKENQPIACSFCDLIGHLQCMLPKKKKTDDSTDSYNSNWLCGMCRCQICFELRMVNSTAVDDEDKVPATIVQCEMCKLWYHPDCLANESGGANTMTLPISECNRCSLRRRAETRARLLSEATGVRVLPPDQDSEVEAEAEDSSSNESEDEPEAEGTSASQACKNMGHQIFEGVSEPGSQNSDLPNCSSSVNPQANEFIDVSTSASRHSKRIEVMRETLERDPWTAFAMHMNIKHGITLDKDDWDVIDAACQKSFPAAPRLKRPAQKVTRKINSLVEVQVFVRTVVHRVGPLIVRADFHWRDPEEALGQLLTSPSNQKGIPLFGNSHKDCAARSTFGKRFEFLREEFIKKNGISGDSLVLGVQIFSDGTNTNFSSMHGFLLSLLNLDRSGRVLNMKTSQVMIACSPTASNLRYFRADDDVEIGFAEAHGLFSDLSAANVLRHLLRGSVAILLEQLKSLENGFQVEIDGKLVKVYAFLYSWIADMEERRDILNLALSQHWVCPHCFGRPVPDSQPCPDPVCEALISQNAPRDKKNLLLLRTKLTEDEELVGKEAWSFEHRFGYFPDDLGPFDQSKNFLMGSGSAYTVHDQLHMTDGIANRLWRIMEKGVYGSGFGVVTQKIGNVHYGVAKSMRFHKMEESLADFQYLLLALAGLDYLPRARAWKATNRRASHVRLTAAFLLILVLLKDEAPGLILNELREAVDAFREEFNLLQDDLRSCEIEGLDSETAKVHELIEHVPAQVEAYGPSSNHSTNIGEWANPSTKAAFKAGSRRFKDIGPSILRRGALVAMFADGATPMAPKGRFRNPFRAVARFHLKNVNSNPNDLAFENLAKVTELYAVEFESPSSVINTLRQVLDEYGIRKGWPCSSSMECELICTERDMPIKSPMTITVPGVGGRRKNRVIAYRSDRNPVGARSGTNEPACCRFHDPSCELHCSFARLSSGTSIGLPLLFVGNPSWGEKGVIVLRLREQESSKGDDPLVRRILRRCEVPLVEPFELVRVSRIRTTCLAVRVEKSIMVTLAGERVFGHLG